MDTNLVGNQIAILRRNKGLTQNELGERLGISFQAVSKWERGETLSDTAILLDLADVLETTVDYILAGGHRALNYRGKITVAQMKDGIAALKRMGELLGRENILYRSAVDGINEKMNTKEPLNKSTAAAGGSFALTSQFEKWEIHKVFLQFQTSICAKISRHLLFLI